MTAKVTVVHTHRDGRLGVLSWTVYSIRESEVWQSGTSARMSAVRCPTPDDKYLCAVDNGIDQVKVYTAN